MFLMEMSDLRAKSWNTRNNWLLNHYRKSVQNSMRLQDVWIELKL